MERGREGCRFILLYLANASPAPLGENTSEDADPLWPLSSIEGCREGRGAGDSTALSAGD